MDVDVGFATYREMKAAQPSSETFTTDELLVEAGYALHELPSMDQARAVFEFALTQFPQSAYSHDGLADVAASEGDYAASIVQFEASLRLDPENDYAIDGLKRVRALLPR